MGRIPAELPHRWNRRLGGDGRGPEGEQEGNGEASHQRKVAGEPGFPKGQPVRSARARP